MSSRRSAVFAAEVAVALLAILACNPVDDNPAATAQGGIIYPGPTLVSEAPDGGAASGASGSTGSTTEFDSGFDGNSGLTEGGATTTVGTGIGTSGGVPAGAGLGATGTGDNSNQVGTGEGTGGGIPAGAGLGATGTSTPVPAPEAGTGAAVIVVVP